MAFAKTYNESKYVFINNGYDWHQVFGNKYEYIEKAEIVCAKDIAKINIEWGSESGDYVIFDTYISKGIFFKRQIKYARTKSILRQSKLLKNSRPNVDIPKDIEEYKYLFDEYKIYTEARNLPFILPKCAEGVFNK